MKIETTKFRGVLLIHPDVHEDHRGLFMETYHSRKLGEVGIEDTFIQENHSLSVQVGTLRGLHYQIQPEAQAKLVRTTAGEIFDVVVDIRRNSPTFGLWQSFLLSSTNKLQLYIPEGFAHGFCTTKPDTEVVYKINKYYSPEHERGITWNDPMMGIDWPVKQPILSDKDDKYPPLSRADFNFTYGG